MGTNFYCHHILTEAEKDELKSFIDNGKLDILKEELDNYKPVHLCKMSCGWKTCFDHNWGEYYNPNKESIDAFIRQGVIKDEYGDVYTPEEFWFGVEVHDFTNTKRSTENEYFEEDAVRCKQVFGITTNVSDFINDTLRFAVYTDFC